MKLNYPLGTTMGKDICFLCWIKEAAEATWAATGKHAPQVIFRKKGRIGMLTITQFVTVEEKLDAYDIIHRLRQDCDTVAFVCVGLFVKTDSLDAPKEGLVISLYQSAAQPEGWVAFVDPLTKELQLPWEKCGPFTGLANRRAPHEGTR